MATQPSLACDYGRFALFIDGSNFYHTIRDLHVHVDYRRLLSYFSDRGTLVRAHYYTALLDGNRTPDWLMRLTDWLSYNGFQVITKRAKTFQRQVFDERGATQWTAEVRGDVSIELTVDMLTLTPYCDTMLLFSGNGDYLPLIRAVQEQGCRCIVVSSERTSDSSVADELRRCADQFLELMDIVDEIRMVGDRG